MPVGLLAFPVMWSDKVRLLVRGVFQAACSATTGNRDIGLYFDTLVTSEPLRTGTTEDTFQALGICPVVNSSVIPYVQYFLQLISAF